MLFCLLLQFKLIFKKSSRKLRNKNLFPKGKLYQIFNEKYSRIFLESNHFYENENTKKNVESSKRYQTIILKIHFT